MDVLYICSKEKKLLCRASSKGLLVWQIQLGLKFSSCHCTKLLQRSDQIHDLGYGGAFKTPSVLNVFASEEPKAKLLILYTRSPTPRNAWEATVWFLRCLGSSVPLALILHVLLLGLPVSLWHYSTTIMLLRCQTFTEISLHISWSPKGTDTEGLCMPGSLAS